MTKCCLSLLLVLAPLQSPLRVFSPAHAASVTEHLLTASQTVAAGSNISMSIMTNAGSSHVLTDQLRVTFNATKLQFVSISYSGSGLDTDTQMQVQVQGITRLVVIH